MFFKITTVVTLVGGVMFLLWLGEQITERGIGNGVSLLIFSGIVAELPRALVQILSPKWDAAGKKLIFSKKLFPYLDVYILNA